MSQTLKLEEKHYYIILAFTLFLFSIFVIDSYNALTYEDPIGEISIQGYYYQGPVPEGYDVEHFRKTGETIKEELVIYNG